MGSIIDVAYNIVSKYKIGIKFDDLYEQIARKLHMTEKWCACSAPSVYL